MALVATPRVRKCTNTPNGKKQVAIVGSTGSVGTSTLDVIRANPDLFEVVLLSAGSNSDALFAQAREFSPRYLHLASPEGRKSLTDKFAAQSAIKILDDNDFHQFLSSSQIDVVVAAAVGFAGLSSVVSALQGGALIALANKESLVSAGRLISQLIERHGSSLIPVDSEHSAIFQALQGECMADIERLVITASGGPFFGFTKEQLTKVTVTDALKHPTWRMGAKISIDSASLVNKSLELAEAYWLFGVEIDKLSILVHPQSIVHSLVEFCDGSSIAQMGLPDMKVPLAYALHYPEGRLGTVGGSLDLAQIGMLNFYTLDEQVFTAPALMRSCLKQGGCAAAVFTIANDIAVERFLGGRLRFDGILTLIENGLERFGTGTYETLSDLLDLRDTMYAQADLLTAG